MRRTAQGYGGGSEKDTPTCRTLTCIAKSDIDSYEFLTVGNFVVVKVSRSVEAQQLSMSGLQ